MWKNADKSLHHFLQSPIFLQSEHQSKTILNTPFSNRRLVNFLHVDLRGSSEMLYQVQCLCISPFFLHIQGIFHSLPVSRVSLWPWSTPAWFSLRVYSCLDCLTQALTLLHSHLFWLVLLLSKSEPQLSSCTYKPPSHLLVYLHSASLGIYWACYLLAKDISYFLSLILCHSGYYEVHLVSYIVFSVKF